MNGSLPELPDPDELLEGKAGEAQLELLHTRNGDRATGGCAVAGAKASRPARDPRADDGIVLERNIEPGESSRRALRARRCS